MSSKIKKEGWLKINASVILDFKTYLDIMLWTSILMASPNLLWINRNQIELHFVHAFQAQSCNMMHRKICIQIYNDKNRFR